MSIAENIAKVEERICKACIAAGRKREEITLMGVSKFIPINTIKEAFKAGITYFGESRVKEAMEKFTLLGDKRNAFQLHLIGSLQRNKAKSAVLFFDCIQSVDRMELIAELKKHSELLKQEHKPAVLLELHTGEESKSGFSGFDNLFRAAEEVLQCDRLRPQGLMTMAPFTDDVKLIRNSFRQLVKAQGELVKRFPPKENWECLSMGMSNDFEIAVEEGSTMLRIGSLIFKDI